ncbi:hypothetical protein M501DRAFT_997457, partial [Patellaria atrata CBS 101060]
MSNGDFLGRAISVVQKAIENDTAGEYKKAYDLYYQARECSQWIYRTGTNSSVVELFMLALKC